MQFNALIPELTVADIERTKVFYTDILGFNIDYERVEDKFILLSLTNSQMMFEDNNGQLNVVVLEHPYGRGINFEITISDVEELYQSDYDLEIKPFRDMTISHYRIGNDEIFQNGYLLRFTD